MSYQVIAETPEQPLRWTILSGEGEALAQAKEWRESTSSAEGASVRILGAHDVVLHAWDGGAAGWTARAVPPRPRLPAWKNALWRLGVGLRYLALSPTEPTPG